MLKINSNNEKADLSASKGTIVDDWAMSLDISCFKILVPLMVDMIACLSARNGEVHLFFMTLRDLDKHLNLLHIDIPVQ